MVKKAMIMAAGAGTRLDPLTRNTPKPMIPVANMPIMEIILNHIKKFGIKDVVANTHSLADCIHQRFENNNLGINFNYVYEEQLSGTAGGVKKCEWFFEPGETFIVVSGDALTDVNIEALVKKHKESGAIASMALKEVPLSEVKNFGVVVVDDNHRVVGFQEKPDIEEAKSNLVNTGIYVFETDIFKYIPENTFFDFAKNVFPSLMENNEILSAHVINEYWSDIGTINQYRMSSYDVFTQKVSIDPHYKKSERGWISSKANISDKASINGEAVVGDNTVIENYVKLFGNTIIGNNCVIKEGAKIRNAIIWDNVIVEKGANLDGCIIANNAVVGENSLITPGSIIPDSCHIAANEKVYDEIRLNPGEKFSSEYARV